MFGQLQFKILLQCGKIPGYPLASSPNAHFVSRKGSALNAAAPITPQQAGTPAAGMRRVAVIIATVGRAQLVSRIVDSLSEQSLQPSQIIVVGAQPADVAATDASKPGVQVLIGQKGLTRQRNLGLDSLAGDTDAVVFIDDDFLAHPDFLAEALAILDQHPDIAGVTGELLADGAKTGEITLDQAQQIIATQPIGPRSMRHRDALYGCNMVMRGEWVRDLRFDENLPLYGWQEDIDFSVRLSRRGRLVSTPSVTGVHMGNRGGRTSGVRLGYSQIANIVYLNRKGTMVPKLGRKLVASNVAANLVRSLWPEPHIDRRGRLQGNAMALADLLRGRLDPQRIERM